MNYIDPDWGLLLGGFVALAIRLSVYLLLAVLAASVAAIIGGAIWRVLKWVGRTASVPTGDPRPGNADVIAPPTKAAIEGRAAAKPKPALGVIAVCAFVVVALAVIPFLPVVLLGLGYVALALTALTAIGLVGRMLFDIARSAKESATRKWRCTRTNRIASKQESPSQVGELDPFFGRGLAEVYSLRFR